VRKSFAQPASGLTRIPTVSVWGEAELMSLPTLARGTASGIQTNLAAVLDVRTRSFMHWSHFMSTFALVLVVLWLLGSISSLTMGGLIHILLILAIGMMLPRVIHGRKLAEH
jgi:hypothetical protein